MKIPHLVSAGVWFLFGFFLFFLNSIGTCNLTSIFVTQPEIQNYLRAQMTFSIIVAFCWQVIFAQNYINSCIQTCFHKPSKAV